MRYGRLSEDGEVAQSHGDLPIPASEPPPSLLPVVYSGPADDNTQVADAEVLVVPELRSEDPEGPSLGAGDGDRPPKNAAAWLAKQAKAFSSDARARTTVLINLAAVMERTDEQMLPAVYAFVACSFNATLTQLGNITLCRALVQAIASPLGGFLGHYYDRTWVITVGCVIWGLCTAGFGSMATSVGLGMLFWAFNGIGLSMVIPNSQSLTADYYGEHSRGKAFGALYLTGALGGMIGALYATNMGGIAPFGAEGWRVAFVSVGAVSLGIGCLNLAFAKDPRVTGKAERAALPGQSEPEPELSLRELWAQIKGVVTVPTFLIIVLQGIVGSTPWNALVFFTLYLQLIGMSDLAASLLMALFLAGTAAGGLLGGWVGDRASRRFPSHGRILACQFSVFSGIPLSVLLMKGLPYDGAGGTVFLYAMVMLSMGLVISWAAPACNNPIFAEIVPPDMRNMIYAFDRSFEGAIAALAAPLVGALAEQWFGYSGTGPATPPCAGGIVHRVERDVRKAQALGNALLVFMVVPWTLCGIFYTGLHYTYPRDRAAALLKAGLLEIAPDEVPDAESADKEGSAEIQRSEGLELQPTGFLIERQHLMPEGSKSSGDQNKGPGPPNGFAGLEP